MLCSVDRSMVAAGGSVFISVGPPRMPKPPKPTVAAVAFALDESGSMDKPFAPGEPPRRHMMKRGMAAAAGALDKDAVVTVVRFATRAHVVYRGTAGELAARPDLAVEAQVGGATNFEAALLACATELRPHRGIRRILLFTDGEPTDGALPEELAELGSRLATEGIHIDALGIGEESRDSLLSSLVGDTGQTAHATATSNDAADFQRMCRELVQWGRESYVQGGRIRVSVHPAWRVGAVLRTHPQERMLSGCVTPGRNGSTLVTLPLGAFGGNRWRPAFVVELIAPATPQPSRQIVKADGVILIAGEKEQFDGASAEDVRIQVVPNDANSVYLQHDPMLARLVEGARLVDEVDLKVSQMPTGQEARIYEEGATRARKRGMTDLAHEFQNALEALSEGNHAVDVQSATRARAARARTAVADVLGETKARAPRNRAADHPKGK
ncbi:VWA domain-containing protein [Streptomyces tropicalis]|uniref:VWA domain-containing protein n=1 Tax=Streptomyces tropicalis TaxID=3034234 RepID=A0ABT6A6Q4_9ACTN|nr:vWA domain-containing protein [Streptomyces tropicalis]MDF3300051.1 VWA domain-containing protein [Streptomyces tropicalis]